MLWTEPPLANVARAIGIKVSLALLKQLDASLQPDYDTHLILDCPP